MKGMVAELLRGLDLSFMVSDASRSCIHGVFDRGFGRILIALTKRYIIHDFAMHTDQYDVSSI